jgi:hypothetical protein
LRLIEHRGGVVGKRRQITTVSSHPVKTRVPFP